MSVNKRFPLPPATCPAASGQSASQPAPYGHPGGWDAEIRPEPLTDIFARQARARPDAPLVEFLGRIFSYGELHAEARRFAAGLVAQGIARGDRVGLFLPNVPAYVSAYYGAMLAGAVVVNFSPLYSAEELAAQVEDSGTRLLVTLDSPILLPTAVDVLDRSSLERLAVTRLADALPLLKSLALRTLGRKQIAAIPHRPDVSEWGAWLSDGAPQFPTLGVDDLALLQYTGGTTGTPKGAMLTHANLAANAIQVDKIDPFDRAAPDIVMGGLPLFHVFANTCVLNRTVVKGGQIVMVPRFDAGQVLKTIHRMRPVAFPGVPTMFQALLDHDDFEKTDWSSLKICISGGAPLPAPVRERFEAQTGVRLVEGYGLTESSGVVSTNPYEGLRKSGTIGLPVPGTQILLLDKEDAARTAPDGEPGELAVRGPQVMQGYWNKPEAQADAFAMHEGEAWLRTGDVASIDADGFLAIVDRIKDMISVGGFKVFPSQVEQVLQQHPAVKEVLVIGVPDAYRGEMPQAYVVLNEDAEETGENTGDDTGWHTGWHTGGETGETLAKWLNARVGKHERVAAVVLRAELPRTMIGKLDRKALRAEVLPA